MEAEGWKTFIKTGQVKDYLDYRQYTQQVTNREETAESVRGETGNGPECYPDRNGASDNAYW